MSIYPAIETAVLTLVRAYNSGATFTTSNSSISDWRVLDASGTDYAAVVMMERDSQFGTSLDGRGAMGKWQELHYPAVEVFRKRGQGTGGDGASRTELVALVSLLDIYLSRYHRLNDTAGVKRMVIERISRPALTAPSEGATATHWMARLSLKVHCEVEFDYSIESPS